jgi:hypothetical protein
LTGQLKHNYDLHSAKYDCDLIKQNIKTTTKVSKKNDLTVEIKDGLKKHLGEEQSENQWVGFVPQI